MRVFRHPIMVFSTIDSEASAPPRYMPPLNIPADTDKYNAYDVCMYRMYVPYVYVCVCVYVCMYVCMLISNYVFYTRMRIILCIKIFNAYACSVYV